MSARGNARVCGCEKARGWRGDWAKGRMAARSHATPPPPLPTCPRTGSWYYDYSNPKSPRQRIDRATGTGDRYCSTVVKEDAPCSHVVVSEERYLIWPTLSKCCGCCNATVGCGVVKPTWMRDAGGTWADTAPFTGPVWSGSADSWEINGLQPNYWFTEAGTDTPVGFAQVPTDYQYFDPKSYVVGPQPDALFELPSYCTPSCGAGICATL